MFSLKNFLYSNWKAGQVCKQIIMRIVEAHILQTERHFCHQID